MDQAPANSVVRSNPRAIPDTLKEAVVDGLLSIVTARLSGKGDYGTVIYGTKPRAVLSSGFWLPFDRLTDGDEESASIRICSHGIDMLISGSRDSVMARASVAIYVRVFPTAADLLTHPSCDPK